jgi:hypothetical protein
MNVDQKDTPFVMPAIQTHVGILQDIIQRLSGNSSNCKTWCIGLVTAVLVYFADKGKLKYSYIVLLPLFVLGLLDAYYLALEKSFRDSYNSFVKKIHCGKIKNEDFFDISKTGNCGAYFCKAVCSYSVWGFYLLFAILILLLSIVNC